MKKQKKISVSDSTAPKPFKPVIGKNAFISPGNPDKEMDADELIHQNRDEEPDDAAFDEDEAVHKVKRNTNIEPGSMADIDDLVHENAEEDDEPM